MIAQNTTVYAIGRGGRDRKQAFRRPLRPDWTPAIGEYVFVPHIPRTIGSLVATACVKEVAGKFVRVIARYGTRTLSEVYEIGDLRPVPRPRRKTEA